MITMTNGPIVTEYDMKIGLYTHSF